MVARCIMKSDVTFGWAKIAIQCLAILVFFTVILFAHSATARIFAVASLMTVQFCLLPNLFRDRWGSVAPMFVMLTLVWLGVAGMLLYWLFAGH